MLFCRQMCYQKSSPAEQEPATYPMLERSTNYWNPVQGCCPQRDPSSTQCPSYGIGRSPQLKLVHLIWKPLNNSLHKFLYNCTIWCNTKTVNWCNISMWYLPIKLMTWHTLVTKLVLPNHFPSHSPFTTSCHHYKQSCTKSPDEGFSTEILCFVWNKRDHRDLSPWIFILCIYCPCRGFLFFD